MTFSTMYVSDDLFMFSQNLFAPMELDRVKTEFISGGYAVSYDVPEGKDVYMTCENDVYNASYAYSVYRWNWETGDWDPLDSCVTCIYERAPRIKECLSDAEQELLNKGMELAC